MKRKRLPSFPARVQKFQAGTTMIETMFACALLLILAAGIMAIALIATSTTENQGHLAARTTEYTQDKMEQLLSLAYGDSTSDTTQFPAPSSGGTGLTVGGSSDPNNPVASYVDYLDPSGNLLTASGNTPPSGWFYKRVWQISKPTGTSNLKQITVVAIVASNVAHQSAIPQCTLVALKTNPF